MLRIVYRPAAVVQIDQISDYTIAEWGERQAKLYVDDLRRQIEIAADFPGLGSYVYGLPDEYRKVRAGAHRAIYRVTDEELIVVRIIQEREDVPDDIDN